MSIRATMATEALVNACWWAKGSSWMRSACHHGHLDLMSSGHLPLSTSESALASLGHVGLTCQLLNELQPSLPRLLAWNSTHPRQRQAEDTAVLRATSCRRLSFWMELNESALGCGSTLRVCHIAQQLRDYLPFNLNSLLLQVIAV